MPGRVRTEIHLTARDTAGAFCSLLDHPPAGWSLPAHLHRGCAETIHIVEGDFEMTINGHRELIRPGATCHIPPEIVHAGGNVGAVTGRRIVIFSPAGMENHFLEAGRAGADDDVDVRHALAAATRHGWEFIA
jgi:mannose-6-phosphate isomerase-like protein (cupin superfamily)